MVRVYASASVGNVGIGFDTLGMSIKPIDGSLFGDYVSIKSSDSFIIKNTGLFHHQLPIKLEENIIFQCWNRFCEITNESHSDVSIQLEKNIPVSSGLGSSAASIVAALVAMNNYYNNPLDNYQLLKLMGEMEGKISGEIHFDNVLSCFLGGMQIVLPEYDNFCQVIPIFDHWIWILAYPGTRVSTIQSRSILPKEYTYRDCIKHSQNLSGFIHACHTKQEKLAIRYIQEDVIAEPYRSKLLPVDLLYIRKTLIKKGALSCGISGAGPTIFVLCNTEGVINDIMDWLSNFYLQNDSGFIKICSTNHSGVHIMME